MTSYENQLQGCLTVTQRTSPPGCLTVPKLTCQDAEVPSRRRTLPRALTRDLSSIRARKPPGGLPVRGLKISA